MLKNGVAEAPVCETSMPNALVIVPTRELAIQIFLEARKFCFGSRLHTVVIYGGVSVSHQLGKLSDGCNILVATPGRLGDFISRGRVSIQMAPDTIRFIGQKLWQTLPKEIKESQSLEIFKINIKSIKTFDCRCKKKFNIPNLVFL